MICAAMVESIVLDCLLITRPKRDHTRSEGAEVGEMERKRRARRARRGNSDYSRLPLNIGLWLWSVPWQKRGSRAEPVCQFPLHIAFLLLFLLLGLFLLFHLYVTTTIHVDCRRLIVIDTPSFLRWLFVLYMIRRRVMVCSGGSWPIFLSQFLHLHDDIVTEWNKDGQHAIVRKEQRHKMEKERFRSVPLLRCKFHTAINTPSTSKAGTHAWQQKRKKRQPQYLGSSNVIKTCKTLERDFSNVTLLLKWSSCIAARRAAIGAESSVCGASISSTSKRAPQ